MDNEWIREEESLVIVDPEAFYAGPWLRSLTFSTRTRASRFPYRVGHVVAYTTLKPGRRNRRRRAFYLRPDDRKPGARYPSRGDGPTEAVVASSIAAGQPARAYYGSPEEAIERSRSDRGGE